MRLWRLALERLLAATAFSLAWTYAFIWVEHVNDRVAATGGHFVQLECSLDHYIPFVPAFIFPYYLYFVWAFLIVLLTREQKTFYHATAAYVALSAAALGTWVLFPSQMARPPVVGHSIAEELVRSMYHVDHGFNLMPSLHVAHTVLGTLFFRQYKPKYFPIVLAGTIAISISTVFVKQHYLVDIPAGVLYAFAAFYLTQPVASLVGNTVRPPRHSVEPVPAVEAVDRAARSVTPDA